MSDTYTVTFENVTVTRETSKGESNEGVIFCMIEGEEVMIPKKVIHTNSEVYKEDTEGDLILPTWFTDLRGMTP